MTHLTKQDINGYIHRTLTDAHRETMDRHLLTCAGCRTFLQEAENLRREMVYDLSDELRAARPSQKMRFNQIHEGLNRRRRWSIIRFHSMQMLSAIGIVVTMIGLGYFALVMMQNATSASPASPSKADLLASATIVPLFKEAWTDPAPFQNVLIEEQQAALEMLSTAPIYHIDMTVSDDLRWVNGRQQLRYLNQSEDTLESLLFHLYPNQTYGSLDVYDVEVNGRHANHQLLEDNENLVVRLPYPLQPGETAVVEMGFALGIGRSWQVEPELGEPSHNMLHLTQFHPTLAVYDAENGWDSSPTSHQLSYNLQPAFYRLRVELPDSQRVISSGEMISRDHIRKETEMREVITISAGPVDEFYLTISDPFRVEMNEVVGETRINSYAHSPDQLEAAQAALEFVTTAVAVYNEKFGTYPFTELDIINVPSLAFARQGVAYSGVILLEHDSHQYILERPENALLHQVGSQWFDPTVATTRLQTPWLVDGLTEYASTYFYADQAAATHLEQLHDDWTNRVEARKLQFSLPATAYGDLSYFYAMNGTAPLFLTAVAEQIGQADFDAFLREYYQRFRWGGADAAAFQQLAEKHCACDLTPLFIQWGVVDKP